MSTKPKKIKDPSERKRLIGTRTEVVTRPLTPAEMEAHHERLIELLQDKAGYEERKKAQGAELAAKIKLANADINDTLECLRRKRVDEDITVEEWLTAGNEVHKINAETGERLGARTANPRELQEELDLPEPAKAPTPSADEPMTDDDSVDGQGAEVGADRGNVVAGDFGGNGAT